MIQCRLFDELGESIKEICAQRDVVSSRHLISAIATSLVGGRLGVRVSRVVLELGGCD